jgi:hypothetical protein
MTPRYVKLTLRNAFSGKSQLHAEFWPRAVLHSAKLRLRTMPYSEEFSKKFLTKTLHYTVCNSVCNLSKNFFQSCSGSRLCAMPSSEGPNSRNTVSLNIRLLQLIQFTNRSYFSWVSTLSFSVTLS